MKLWIEISRLVEMLRSHGVSATLHAGLDKLIRWVTGRPSNRFGWITPAILLGGQPARQMWPYLIRRGITGVINLRQEYDYLSDVNGLALRYLYLPTLDNTAPSYAHLAQGVAFLQAEIDGGGKVYVHCWEGLGRSPTLVAAYLVSTGLSPDEAWAKIRRVRPFIRPNAEQQASLRDYARQRGLLPGDGAGVQEG